MNKIEVLFRSEWDDTTCALALADEVNSATYDGNWASLDAADGAADWVRELLRISGIDWYHTKVDHQMRVCQFVFTPPDH